MDFTDTYVTTTAEGVPLETTLAGLGSRAIAVVIDTVIQGIAILLLLAVVGAIVATTSQSSPLSSQVNTSSPTPPSTAGLIALAIVIVVLFLIPIGYFIAFETWNAGRTPGKQIMGIRAVRLEGNMGFMRSVIRNLFRLIDEMPFFYLIGIISVLATKKNQRLGDLVAGTVVVRYRTGADQKPTALPYSPGPAAYPAAPYSPGPAAYPAAPYSPGPAAYPPGPAAYPYAAIGQIRPEAATWDTSAITTSEIFAVEQFLQRRASLQPEARGNLATSLATGLSSKLGGNVNYISQMHPEEVLEQIYLVKTARGQGRGRPSW